jgi:lipoate-protein ligase A
MMRGALRKDTSKYETRAVRSNPASVTNLLRLINKADTQIETILKFRSLMMDWILINIPGSLVADLSEKEISDINSLAETKYRTWEWNYAYGPEYHFNTSFEHSKSIIYCSLHVKDGIIWEIETKGPPELEKAGKELIGCRHMPGDIQQVLEKENIFKSGFDIYNLF